MNKQEIEQNLIFLFARGSQAYGTNTPSSDEDIGGICLPTKRIIYGLDKFEQDDRNWFDTNNEPVDKTVYNIVKAFQLFSENNPNMLDFLYAPERTIKYITPIWESVMAIRDEFLCVKAKWTYQGYAVSQLNRIKTHRSYLLNPPKGKPDRAIFGLGEKSIFPETQIEVLAKLSSQYVQDERQDKFYSEITNLFDAEGSLIFKKYIEPEYYSFAIADFKKRQKEFLRMISSVSQHFLKDEYKDMAGKELAYIAALNDWESYQRWTKHRNSKRAEMEAKSGYDLKHAMHLIRLLRMGVEILEGKGVNVDRTNIDREHLMDIRNGVFNFDQILEESNALNAKADELYKTCALPKLPNQEKIDKLLVAILDTHLIFI